MKPITIYPRKSKKGVTIYMAQYCGSSIPRRESTKVIVPIKYYDFEKNAIKRNCPNRELLESTLSKRIEEFKARNRGVYFGDESEDFLEFIEHRIQKSNVREVSKDKYAVYYRNLKAIVKGHLKKTKLPISDLRNPQVIDVIREFARVNLKNPNRMKSDTTYNSTIKAIAREIEHWNNYSETQYPINVNRLLSNLPKKTSKAAKIISGNELLRFNQTEAKTKVQGLSKRIFLFQYLCGGIRISDAMLLTNKGLQNGQIKLQTMKNRVNIERTMNRALFDCLADKWSLEQEQAKKSFQFKTMNLDVDLTIRLKRVIRNWFEIEMSYEDCVQNIKEAINLDSHNQIMVEDLKALLELVDNRVFSTFTELVSKKPQQFVFPLLNFEDFKDVWYDTTKFNKHQNKKLHNGRQRHIQGLRRFCESNGFPVFTGHSPRHSFASEMLNSPGITIKDISDVLGHKNERTTLAYIHGRFPDSHSSKTVDRILKGSNLLQ